MKTQWISLHAFVGDYPDYDALLTDALSPLLASLKAEQPDTSFFFLRYWNGGPHLRLRFKGTCLEPMQIKERVQIALQDDTYNEYVEPMATDYSLIAKRMSHVDENISSNTFAIAEPIESFQQRGSVQIRPYAIENARFGGMRAAPHAEKHFCVSSALALSLLVSTVGNIPHRFMIALHLAVATLSVLSLSHSQQLSLLVRRRALQSLFFPEFQGNMFQELGFHTYDHQRGDLGPIIEQIHSFESPNWRIPVVALWRRELERCNQMMSPMMDVPGPQFCDVAMDFLHLLFNRLGILTVEELYLYELLSRSLERVVLG